MISKRKVYFRADADRSIGFGHFIRSLALADMLKDEFDCTFFTQLPTAYQKEEVCKICKLVELPVGNAKFSLFLDALQGDEIVFLDNYFFSSEYQRLVKEKGCKLVCIGGNDRHYYSDILINYTDIEPENFSVEYYTKFCLGIDWALLRSPFWSVEGVERLIPKKVNSVAVCFGGTDPLAVTEMVVQHLQKKFHGIGIHIIATDSFGLDRIECLLRGGVSVHTNVSAQEIATVFRSVDVAVLAASSVALEALALRTPVIAGYYIDNQKGIYRALEERNYILGVGNLLDSLAGERIVKCIKRLPAEQVNKLVFNLSSIKNKYIHLFEGLCS